MSRTTLQEIQKSSTLRSDNSWIRNRNDDAEDEEDSTGMTSATSVQALAKRFSSQNEDWRSSTLPSPKSSSTYYSQRSSFTDDPGTSYTTTTITRSGDTTETTTTTTKSVKSPTDSFTNRVFSSKAASYSYPAKPKVTEIKTEIDDQLDELRSIEDYTPESKSTVSTTETVTVKTSSDEPEDKLYDTLIPQAIRSSSIKSDTTRTTETVTVKSSGGYSSYTDDSPSSYTSYSTKSRSSDDGYDSIMTRSSSQIERSSLPSSTSYQTRSSDDGYDSIMTRSSSQIERSSRPSSTSYQTTSYTSYGDDLPSSRSSSYTISSNDDYTSNRRTSSRSDSGSGSTVYSSYKTSRSDDGLSDGPYSRSSVKSTYSTLERPVLEKDLCTSCRKVFNGDAKMVLSDMKINCHAFCFKCGVCNGSLSHLKAGDTIWVYHHIVHCENCFEAIRAKWRR